MLWARLARIKGSCFRLLVAAPLAVALLAVGGLTTSTSASAATTASSGFTVTTFFEPDGTMFYDPSSGLALFTDRTPQEWCNRDFKSPDEVPVHIAQTALNGQFFGAAVAGTNVPIYLYRTTSPVTNIEDILTACASGVFVSPPVGTGTASAAFAFQTTPGTSTSGKWEEAASGTYVDAITGNTCHVTAIGGGPWTDSIKPAYYDDISHINTNGC